MYFGADDEQAGFTSRAYRDMSRTLHGLSERGNKHILKAKAAKALRTALNHLVSLRLPRQPARMEIRFDAWHREACANLIGAFHPFPCHYGQAQKWLNMTVKYRWFFSPNDELWKWHSVAHVPVDDFVLRAAKRLGIPPRVKKAWSRWQQEEYETFQNNVRIYARKHQQTPLAIEHSWWMDQSHKVINLRAENA
jgi:hypothetical protein